MAYTTPKTDWAEKYEPSPNDMNRIEGNIKHIQGEAASFDGDKAFNDNVILKNNIAGIGITKLTLSSGNFTVPSNVYKIKVTMSGGGGGGGGGTGNFNQGSDGSAGTQSIFNTTYIANGGSGGKGGAESNTTGFAGTNAINNIFSGSPGGMGGGSGSGTSDGKNGYPGVLEIYYIDVTPSSSLPYSIGAGGAGGAGGASGAGSAGGDGGDGGNGYIIVEY